MAIRTSGELEQFTLELLKRQEPKYTGSLEEYLRSLWVSVKNHQTDSVTFALLASILEDGFALEPAPFDNSWLEYTAPCDDWSMECSEDGYGCLEQTLLFQIADLRRMAGEELENELRYFGLESPTQHDWYNFNPFLYLECALAGFISRSGEDVTVCNWATLATILEFGRIYE
jgi:hypothetical protein